MVRQRATGPGPGAERHHAWAYRLQRARDARRAVGRAVGSLETADRSVSGNGTSYDDGGLWQRGRTGDIDGAVGANPAGQRGVPDCGGGPRRHPRRVRTCVGRPTASGCVNGLRGLGDDDSRILIDERGAVRVGWGTSDGDAHVPLAVPAALAACTDTAAALCPATETGDLYLLQITNAVAEMWHVSCGDCTFWPPCPFPRRWPWAACTMPTSTPVSSSTTAPAANTARRWKSRGFYRCGPAPERPPSRRWPRASATAPPRAGRVCVRAVVVLAEPFGLHRSPASQATRKQPEPLKCA